MPDPIVDLWLNSHKYACINKLQLRPKENSRWPGSALTVVRGQASVYFLLDENHKTWILKKFLPAKQPHKSYIGAIQALVPQHPGFESGFRRTVLERSSLASCTDGYFSQDFAGWLENSILMPVAPGSSWAEIADRIRDASLNLTRAQRVNLCEDLVLHIQKLENAHISHRDLSSQNVFIDDKLCHVHLIDWDSLYHPSLSMQPNTTYGTGGYVAPFVKSDIDKTWRKFSDRFSLAILITEFLTTTKGSLVKGDGGAFSQSEIDNRQGTNISRILSSLTNDHPQVSSLMKKALQAQSFEYTPSPTDWKAALPGSPLPQPMPQPISVRPAVSAQPINTKVTHRQEAAAPPRQVPNIRPRQRPIPKRNSFHNSYSVAKPLFAAALLTAIFIGGSFFFTSRWKQQPRFASVLRDEILIPAGEFQMGCADSALNNCQSNPQILQKVMLRAFYIDKYEVTNEQYEACVKAGACTPPHKYSSRTRRYYYGSSYFADYPVINVDWKQALAFCTWTGKRLPTENEWEKSARGVNGRSYPWGNRAPTSDLANYYNGNIGDTAPVGEYPAGASPYGLLDMAGNVLEWTADVHGIPVSQTTSNISKTAQTTQENYYAKRGGAWSYSAENLNTDDRFLDRGGRYYDNLGFRCARTL